MDELTHIRYFNTYGPKQSPILSSHVFFNAALNNEEIIIHGTGKQSRTFSHNDNIDATVTVFDGRLL